MNLKLFNAAQKIYIQRVGEHEEILKKQREIYNKKIGTQNSNQNNNNNNNNINNNSQTMNQTPQINSISQADDDLFNYPNQPIYNENIANQNEQNLTNPNNDTTVNFHGGAVPDGVDPAIFNNNLDHGIGGGVVDVFNGGFVTPQGIRTDLVESANSLSARNKKISKIPDSKLLSTKTNWEPLNLKDIDEEYHLYGMASVHIYYDNEKDSVFYSIIEPELDDHEFRILQELKRGFIYVFEKFSPRFKDSKDEEIILSGTNMLLKKYRHNVSEESKKKLIYYLKRDYLGLEMIEPLMHDAFIEDISCDGLNVPLFVNHLKYGALEVNKKYTSTDILNSFIVKLAQQSSQEISLAKPILQGALKDGSRVEAIYGKEISEKGSSFTIRKFRAEPFTPVHLLKLGTMPSLLLAYLWIAVENKQSILVSGGTASGKTTILNALSLFVPPSSKVVSIEDTPEINLPHEHWLPMISREREGKAQITMFDLLKASLRERPDYIIVGEIRGKEASILFQGMATGHAGLGTVHAQKFDDLVNRMTIDPINLPRPLLTEVDIVLFQRSVKIDNTIVRRTESVVEIMNFLRQQDDFEINEFMKFVHAKDEFEFAEQSSILNSLLEKRGGSEEGLWHEIERRKRILDTLVKQNIFEFIEVNKVIRYYYKNPSQVFDYIQKIKAEIEEMEN